MVSGNNQYYRRLSPAYDSGTYTNGDAMGSDQPQTHSKLKKLLVYSVISLLLILFGLVFYNAKPIRSEISASGLRTTQRPCGNSSKEAISNQCTFNQLFWAWIPPECPGFANEEFKAAGDWKYFLDLDGTVEAEGDSWEKAMDNEIPLYTMGGEHMTHCVYLLLSMAQMVRDGSPSIPKLEDFPHIEHCAQFITAKLQRDDTFWKINTKTPQVSYHEYC